MSMSVSVSLGEITRESVDAVGTVTKCFIMISRLLCFIQLNPGALPMSYTAIFLLRSLNNMLFRIYSMLSL